MLVAASRILVPSRVSIAKRNFSGLTELDDPDDDDDKDEVDEGPPTDLDLPLVRSRISNSCGSIGMRVRIVLRSMHPVSPCTGWSSVRDL